jgi:hypothetical protein
LASIEGHLQALKRWFIGLPQELLGSENVHVLAKVTKHSMSFSNAKFHTADGEQDFVPNLSANHYFCQVMLAECQAQPKMTKFSRKNKKTGEPICRFPTDVDYKSYRLLLFETGFDLPQGRVSATNVFIRSNIE